MCYNKIVDLTINLIFMATNPIIRKIYLYLFSTVGLILVIIGGVMLVNLALKAFIFTKAEFNYEYPQPVSAPVKSGDNAAVVQLSKEELDAYNKNQRESQRQRDIAQALAQIIIGIPLYLYHWRVIRNEKETV